MKYIVIVIAIVAAAYFGIYKDEPVIKQLKFTYSDKANLYKCQDVHGDITYSDRTCVNSSEQDLNIVVPVAEKASAERLKALELKNQRTTTSSDSQVSLVKSNEADKTRSNNRTCQRYKDNIKDLQNTMRSGYSAQQGDRMKKSIRDYKNHYNNECK